MSTILDFKRIDKCTGLSITSVGFFFRAWRNVGTYKVANN